MRAAVETGNAADSEGWSRVAGHLIRVGVCQNRDGLAGAPTPGCAHGPLLVRSGAAPLGVDT